MVSAGAYLRELRQTRGVSLEEIARSTRVARRYLEALETDDIAALPARVFARGFIRAYCQMLGVPPEEALARFDGLESAAAAAPHRLLAGARVLEPAPRGRGAVLVSFVLLVVLGLALFAVTLMIQPAPAPHADRRAEPGTLPPAGIPRPGEVGPPTVAAPAPTSPGPPAAEPARTASAAPASAPRLEAALGSVTSPYRLVARVREPTWIRVRTEDGRSSEETVQAGEVREWVSSGPFVVTVGNAGGLSLELNGRTLPPLGPRGAVISRLVLPPERR